MRSRVRQMNPKPTRREPLTQGDWAKLMSAVLARAKAQKDRRLPGLQRAAREHKSAKALKRMGIICEADIYREFPDP